MTKIELQESIKHLTKVIVKMQHEIEQLKEEHAHLHNFEYSLEIMKQELNNKYTSAEIQYAFRASIEAMEILIKRKSKHKED